MKKYNALDLLFETTLRHLYTAEQAIEKELDTLEDYAQSSALKTAFQNHRKETHLQINRLDRAFTILDIDPKSSKLQGMTSLTDQGKELLKTMLDFNFSDRSKGIEGILGEGREVLRHFAQTDANEVALASAGMKVEHFEIACYRLVCILADYYEHYEISDLMKASLDEEMSMSERLLGILQKELSIPADV
jgi:ferritin-like metal-binding protein YciE